MKKALSLALCLSLLLSLAPVAMAADASFTLMVYLCGTDLESNGGMATRDLKEMIAAGVPSGGRVTVYVQTGGTKSWKVKGLTNGEGERWLLSQEGIELTQSLGRVDMGEESTLSDFLRYGFENYPAQRYGLIFWDHGSGATGGLCYDELTENALYMPEIYNGLQKGCEGQPEKPFTFIGFDACLMASYEVALHIAPFARYMVASEELEPGTGWSYDRWLPELVANPAIDMEELGPTMVESFLSATMDADSNDYATLSMIRLDKMDALQSAVESMGKALAGEIDNGNLKAISRLRQNVRSFGETQEYASDMEDMTTFAEVYAKYDKSGATKLKKALAEAVAYSDYTRNLTGVTGLSILVPFATKSMTSYYLDSYKQLELSPEYIAFVDKMLGGMNGGSYSFGTPSVSQQSIQSAQIDWFSQYANDPQSYESNAGSLWDQLYGTDMTQSNEENFSLDSFINSLLGDSQASGGFNENYDDSESSLWGDLSQYSDPSFATDSGFGSGLWASLLGKEDESAGNAGDSNTQGGSLWGDLTGPTTASEQEIPVQTGEGQTTLENPFADSNSDYAYTVQLTQEQMEYLGSVEANLMMDVSDPDFECYVELGYVQDLVTDWNSGKIYGMFDGSWATLDGQMVCLYDQIANERYIRSLIPALLNGEETYILVVFNEENPYGVVAGATEGYTDAGLPAKGTTPLKEGDVVIPMYELLYWDEKGEQQSEPFEGDEIIVGKDGTIPFAYAQVENDADYLYGFCLTDIYGESQFTDFMTLSF